MDAVNNVINSANSVKTDKVKSAEREFQLAKQKYLSEMNSINIEAQREIEQVTSPEGCLTGLDDEREVDFGGLVDSYGWGKSVYYRSANFLCISSGYFQEENLKDVKNGSVFFVKDVKKLWGSGAHGFTYVDFHDDSPFTKQDCGDRIDHVQEVQNQKQYLTNQKKKLQMGWGVEIPRNKAHRGVYEGAQDFETKP